MVINGLLAKKALSSTFRLSTIHVDACCKLEDWIENELSSSPYNSYVGFIDLFGVDKGQHGEVFGKGYVASYFSFVSSEKQSVIESESLEHAKIIKHLEQEQSLSSRYREILIDCEVDSVKRGDSVQFLTDDFGGKLIHGSILASLAILAATLFFANQLL